MSPDFYQLGSVSILSHVGVDLTRVTEDLHKQTHKQTYAADCITSLIEAPSTICGGKYCIYLRPHVCEFTVILLIELYMYILSGDSILLTLITDPFSWK